MKYITDKKEIASFFNSHAVIKINMETHIDGYETLYEGENVCVKVPTKNHGELTVFGRFTYSKENNEFYVQNCGTMIKESFGYDDVLEAYERNHAPEVREDDIVGILCDFPKQKICQLVVKRVKRCNLMYYSACTFEDVE